MMAVRGTSITTFRRFCATLGEFGRGAGKSGGSGGVVRSAGGAFGRLEAAHEGEYFYHQQMEQLKVLKQRMTGQPMNIKKLTERERLVAAATEQRKRLAKHLEVE